MLGRLGARAYDRLSAVAGRLPLDRLRWSDRDAILMYHSVRPAADCRPNTSDVPVREFRRQLAYLTRHHEVVDLPAVLEGGGDGKRIALTFDDGYRDLFTEVRPLLHEFDVPATAFVVSGFVDGERPRERAMNTGHLYDPLTDDQLRELAADPLVTVGNHSHTHHDLGRHHDRELLHEEVVGAKERLEDRYGIIVDRFCYPNGAYNESSLDLVRESHALATCDESRRPLLGAEDPHLLPRVDAGLPFSAVRFQYSDANGALMERLGRGPD